MNEENESTPKKRTEEQQQQPNLVKKKQSTSSFRLTYSLSPPRTTRKDSNTKKISLHPSYHQKRRLRVKKSSSLDFAAYEENPPQQQSLLKAREEKDFDEETLAGLNLQDLDIYEDDEITEITNIISVNQPSKNSSQTHTQQPKTEFERCLAPDPIAMLSGGEKRFKAFTESTKPITEVLERPQQVPLNNLSPSRVRLTQSEPPLLKPQSKSPKRTFAFCCVVAKQHHNSTTNPTVLKKPRGSILKAFKSHSHSTPVIGRKRSQSLSSNVSEQTLPFSSPRSAFQGLNTDTNASAPRSFSQPVVKQVIRGGKVTKVSMSKEREGCKSDEGSGDEEKDI